MKTGYRNRNQKLSYQLIISLRASLLACILTALMVLILALLLRWDFFSEAALDSVTILIKGLCACFAGFLHHDRSVKRLWVLAGGSGALYMLLSLLVFSLLSGEFCFHFSQITDVLMGYACAACTCILRRMLHTNTENKKAK